MCEFKLTSYMQKHRFKAELRFFCPTCNKMSKEIILAHARDESAAAIAIVERVSIECQLCKAICDCPAQMQLSMNNLTGEELAVLKIGSAATCRELFMGMHSQGVPSFCPVRHRVATAKVAHGNSEGTLNSSNVPVQSKELRLRANQEQAFRKRSFRVRLVSGADGHR